MTIRYIDIETYSDVDIKKSNVYAYTEDPSFEILMAAWADDDAPLRITTDHQKIRELIADPDVTFYAHHANFERICFSAALGMPVGEYLSPRRFEDSAALAAVNGYPRSLEHLAVALGAEKKDSAGTRLINIFCKPDRHGKRTYPEDKPEEWEKFKRYCLQDVGSMRDIAGRLPGWPTEAEREVFITDQLINDRGILTDWEMAEAAVEAGNENYRRDMDELKDITGLSNPNSVQQLLEWLHARKVKPANLQKATVDGLLANPKLTDDRYPGVRRVLELRQETALVASKKYDAILRCISEDDMLRGSFKYHGAHTGRWSGSGVQLQNLASVSLVPKDADPAEADRIQSDAVEDLKLGIGADAPTLKKLVRASFYGGFTVVDYAAIEARVVAWLAGERWALEAFREGRDIYTETAERMSTADHPLTRKEGKVAVLALGYQGGRNSLVAMGAEGDDEHLWMLVNQWRDTNKKIVRFWADVYAAFRAGDRSAGDHIHIVKDGRDRHIRLPSGRYLKYRDLRLRRSVTKFGGERETLSFSDPKGPTLRTDTYGGRLVENITQAVARDVLAEAMIRLEQRGYPVAGHVHDEVLIAGDHPVETISAIMTEQPVWAEGLPISAEGFLTQRYRKD